MKSDIVARKRQGAISKRQLEVCLCGFFAICHSGMTYQKRFIRW
jgi:hypothetical protein